MRFGRVRCAVPEAAAVPEALKVQWAPPSVVVYRALARVQSVLKCAHVPVPTKAHPVRVLVNDHGLVCCHGGRAAPGAGRGRARSGHEHALCHGRAGAAWQPHLPGREQVLCVLPQNGERYPDVIVFWVPSESDKQALVQDEASPFFTTSHFDGHPSVLLRASRVGELTRQELTEVVQDAWLSQASPRRAAAWLSAQQPGR